MLRSRRGLGTRTAGFWVRNGQIRYREDILDGIEQAPGSIAELYRGKNLGKLLIRIAPEIPA